MAAEVIPWDSESTEKAHVHCVIIGFSHKNSIQKQKYIFDEGGNRKEAKQINGYMIDAADVFIENRAKPLSPVPEIVYGSMPIDDGHLILSSRRKKLRKLFARTKRTLNSCGNMWAVMNF